MMKIPVGAKFLMIGDSITDAGRDTSGASTPWSTAAGLGSGYVSYTQALLDAFSPASRIRIMNRGIGGNTVRNLAARWQSDVLDLHPDWLSVGIGINDVWRQFDSPPRNAEQVLPHAYEETYRGLLARTRPSLQGLVLLSPYVVEPNLEDLMRKRMDLYGGIVRRLAGEFDAVFVDTQALFDSLMQVIPPTELAGDRIHPGTTGHMALARALLEALGFSWNQQR